MLDEIRYYKDKHYHELVINEVQSVQKLVADKENGEVTIEELSSAIKCIKQGKSPDYYGLTIENINYGGNVLLHFLLDVINSIFKNGVIPESLKVGLLTPIFKNKGEKTISINYRGITVLPVIGKVLEAIIRNRIQPMINETQNPSQGGFTAKDFL